MEIRAREGCDEREGKRKMFMNLGEEKERAMIG